MLAGWIRRLPLNSSLCCIMQGAYMDQSTAPKGEAAGRHAHTCRREIISASSTQGRKGGADFCLAHSSGFGQSRSKSDDDGVDGFGPCREERVLCAHAQRRMHDYLRQQQQQQQQARMTDPYAFSSFRLSCNERKKLPTIQTKSTGLSVNAIKQQQQPPRNFSQQHVHQHPIQPNQHFHVRGFRRGSASPTRSTRATS